ncbi:GNAT family N-acetyltransferase [Elioraea tepidiphila]|uniref:GNAT family N-acetyltransferase n=1 Tax=Elioraea tepidiphila TaxID=457934 RepID=UPI00035C8858|nr:GNAT family N-acetyltransferase [Elioraea tepidiphila]
MILHQAVPPDAPPDEQDVLEQVGAVEAALIEAGWRTRRLAAGLDLAAVAGALADDRPDLVINLVESLTVGRAAGVMAPTAAALLESLGLAFTGNTAAALALTADKLATKRVLRATGIATPPWIERDGAGIPGPLIIKHATEHASFAIGPDSVVANADAARALMRARAAEHGGRWFAEAFIDGREFNLSAIDDGAGGCIVLPAAEQVFDPRWPEGRPRIVDWASKWDPTDPIYPYATRSFDLRHDDGPLVERMAALVRRVWEVCGLAGYARVDLRVDRSGEPWVLEVNANPCLTPGMGLAATAERAGMSFRDLVGRIAAAALAEPTIVTPPGSAPSSARPSRPVTAHPPLRTTLVAGDPERIAALCAATGVFTEAEVAVARELAEDRLAQGDASSYRFVLAEQRHGVLVGYACYGPTPCTESAWDLYWIVVHPAAQGGGIGRTLLDRVTEAVRLEGGTALYAETAGKPAYAPTRAFYARTGFRAVATVPDFYARGDAKLILLRPLD